jgi:hypothetical protein
MGLTDKNSTLHAGRTGYYLSSGGGGHPDRADSFFFSFRYPYLSILCSVLGDCCSVAGVGLEELRYLHLECIERGRSKNITVPCVSGSLSLSESSNYTQSHDLSRRPWPIKAAYTRPAETCLAAPVSPPSSSLSGCYEQRFVRRLKLATVVSSSSSSSTSSSCTPSRDMQVC